MKDWNPEAWARLGRALREARERAGLTQGELAEAAGVSKKSVGDAEAGKVPRSRMPYTLAQIAKALDWPSGAVERVLDGGDPPAGWQSVSVTLDEQAVTGILTNALVRATDNVTAAEIRHATKIAVEELRRHGLLPPATGVQRSEIDRNVL